MTLLERLELDLALHGRDQERQIRDARNDILLAIANRAPERVRKDSLVIRDGDSHRHARPLGDVRRLTRLTGHLGDDFLHELGNRRPVLAHVRARVLQSHDPDLLLEGERIVRADLRSVRSFSGVMIRPRLV